MNTWQELKPEFETDGSLRDIYIFRGNEELWNHFLDCVTHSPYRLEFFHGEEPQAIPTDFIGIEYLQQSNPTRLFIWVNPKLQLNCHFFLPTEIELDVSPYDLDNESQFEDFICFLNWLASSLKREVFVTHEGSPSQIILSVGVDAV